MRVLILGFCVLLTSTSRAEVQPAALFTNHAVLQRDVPVPVWGTATAGETVTVRFHDQSRATKADATGHWEILLQPLPAGATGDLVVIGPNRVTLTNVTVGDVWLCGGQSNMEYGLDHVTNAVEEAAQADYPHIRVFLPSPYGRDNLPQETLTGSWAPVRPNAVPGSAVGYFFAREIHRTQRIPVGAIHCAVGATGIRLWMSRPALAGFTELAEEIAASDRVCAAHADQYRAMVRDWDDRVHQARSTGRVVPLPPAPPDGDPRRQDFRRPTFLFNGMVAPLTRFPIRGVIFYQGESDANPVKAPLYARLFPALIADWRRAWGQPDLPFLFVQLANYRHPHPDALAEIRDAQRRALAVPHTGMAVAADVGDPGDIHCANKQAIAHRLGLIARAKVYGEPVEFSGPLIQTVERVERGLRLTFTHAGGLEFRDSVGRGFEVADAAGKFVPATATIDGATVMVRSDVVTTPVTVRYGWGDLPQLSLVNHAHLPAAPFLVSLPAAGSN